MSKLRIALAFSLVLACQSLAAKNQIEIKLQCDILFKNYNAIDHASTSKPITLNAIKHKEGGSQLVAQTDDYEFWVMIHGIQRINKVDFINSFQVAIKQKSSGLFMHALSDMNSSSKGKPKLARISLVDYHPNSFLEKGELLFECRSDF